MILILYVMELEVLFSSSSGLGIFSIVMYLLVEEVGVLNPSVGNGAIKAPLMIKIKIIDKNTTTASPNKGARYTMEATEPKRELVLAAIVSPAPSPGAA